MAKKENEYLENMTIKIYQENLIKEEKQEIILKLKGFNEQNEIIKGKIILYAIKKILGTNNGISKVHIDDIKFTIELKQPIRKKT